MSLRLCVVVVLLAGACSAERPTLQTDGSVSREVDAPVVADDLEPLAASESGDAISLRIAVDGTWLGDPADAGPASLPNRILADLLFEGLARVGSSGASEPALAESWEVSPDRLTWDFFLAADLTDGDGRPVSAGDVVDSLDHVAARGLGDQAATSLVSIVGWHDRMSGNSASVSGIEALDDLIVRIRLVGPFELLPDVLASPAFGIAIREDGGFTGTTGAYRRTDDSDHLVAVSDDAAVESIELVMASDPVSELELGLIDWAVVPQGSVVDELPGDLLRQPLDMRVAMVFRLPDMSERLGLSLLIDPVSIASGIPGMSAIAGLPVGGISSLPDSVVIDIPAGNLGAAAEQTASQFEAAGVAVEWFDSSPAEFASRITSGDATVFPMLIAGGTGAGGATMRFFAPGGVDDVFGDESPERMALAEAAVSEIDPVARAQHLVALEQYLVEQGLVRIVGRYELTIAIGPRLTGLRQRGDGTLDLSGVSLA